MKFGKETIEKFCKFDVEFSNEECTMLKKYGQKLIKDDDAALINYAVNEILKKAVNDSKKA
jgi:hypothetical protein